MRLPFIIAVMLASVCIATESAPVTIRSRADSNSRWWPTQAMPMGLARLTNQNASAALRASYDMMEQSVAGLAAKAVNEGHGDELVWIPTGSVDAEDWLARWLTRHPQVEMRGGLDLWVLVERYAKQGFIKGYILYRPDPSKGEINEHRRSMDCSVNVATSLAGILDGVIVDETLEAQAQQHGLKRLIDVRNKTQAWCFETYKDRFSRAMLCTQDPRKPHVRDLAIAQKAFTGYGDDAPMPAVMKWLTPLSPVLGWNGGDEFKTTEMSSRWGHIQTATDWCINLPVLMAGTEKAEQSRARNFAPRTIDWNDGYEAGAGQVFWVTDRNGVDVPVVSARYSIWSQANRPRIGTPAKVAREIRQTVGRTVAGELPRYDWVIAHVWSWFKRAPGSDEKAEDMPQENAFAQGGVRGYTPVTWCAARLPSDIRTVTPDEMIWRIRMKHDAEQTKKLIKAWPR